MDKSYTAPLPTPREMAAWDKAAIERIGYPGTLLMEAAAREALALVRQRLGDPEGLACVLWAGSGNNGGDAFALARLLQQAGAEVVVWHTRALSDYRGEAGRHVRLARACQVPTWPLSRCDPNRIRQAGRPGPHPAQADLLVDGLLGTGLSGELRPDYLEWVRLINAWRHQALVLALDIPSGLSGLDGLPLPEAVRAHATVTFHAAKTGLVMPRAREYVGDLSVADIGIPSSVMDAHPCDMRLITGNIGAAMPCDAPDMHKGTAGHVLVAGGSPGLSGAVGLTARSALRAGAGLATAACPAGLSGEIKSMGPDIITLPLEVGVTWSPSSARVLSRVWGPYDVLVLGPGLGREPMTTEFIKELLLLRRKERPGLRAVFDADALFHLAEDTELLSPETLLPGDVLTPHPGEMARLLDSSISQVQKDRPGACRKLAAASGAVAVLKGAGTLVSAGGQDHGPLYLEASACPALAVGGSGDVLSGVIGALLARGLTSLEAACLGVHWHGLAGRLLAHEHPRRGNLPQEIAAALPKAGAVLFGDRENHGP